MKFGIFSLTSGNALGFYETQSDADAAMRQIVQSEPDATDKVGLISFEDWGEASWTARDLNG